MGELQIPFPLKGVPVKPEMTGRLKMDDQLMQTLAALCGYDGEARRLLTCSVNGSLNTTTAVVSAVINKTTTGAAEAITFSSTPTTEVMIKANPLNSGDVWVNVGAAAGVDTGWVLCPGDWVRFSVNDLDNIRLYVVTSGDKVIIARTT